MLQILISIVAILLTIFFVIGTHEFAHFITARLLGVKVLRFSIGFGKTLLRWYDKKGTEYVFALIPLGGYVKMLDESEETVPVNELPYAFNRQPLYKKFMIVAAGPIMNIACAFLLYWLIFMVGFVSVKPIIGEITPHSIAAKAGLKGNQEIIRIDQHETVGWPTVLFRLIAHAGNEDKMHIEVKNVSDQKTAEHTLDLATWHMDELNPDPLGSIGIAPYQPIIPLVIGIIAPDTPAATSSLQMGDKVLAVDGKPLKKWNELTTYITDHPNQTVQFKIERKNKILEIPVKLGVKRDLLFTEYGYLGISPDFKWPEALLRKIQYSPLTALSHAAEEVWTFTYLNLLLFGKLITGKLSLQSLGGPITIFENAGAALNYGLLPFLSFLAFLSISIGIINFLPIPGLDGGHLFVYIIEFIIRRPIPDYVLTLMYKLGLILILFFLFQAVFNDLLRLY